MKSRSLSNRPCPSLHTRGHRAELITPSYLPTRNLPSLLHSYPVLRVESVMLLQGRAPSDRQGRLELLSIQPAMAPWGVQGMLGKPVCCILSYCRFVLCAMSAVVTYLEGIWRYCSRFARPRETRSCRRRKLASIPKSCSQEEFTITGSLCYISQM